MQISDIKLNFYSRTALRVSVHVNFVLLKKMQQKKNKTCVNLPLNL